MARQRRIGASIGVERRASRPNGLTLGQMIDLATTLARTAGGMASGLLGAALCMLLQMGLDNIAGRTTHINSAVYAGVGFVLGVSLYALIGQRRYRCLENAHLMFVDGCITETEYNLMRRRCLKIDKLV